jgi:hypothetical protein
MSAERLTAACACGAVELEATGKPIIGVVCYCDDCQAAARQIEALSGAAPFCQSDGGTPFIVYRKDRVRWIRGEQQLTKCKLREGSATNRWVAGCCNSVMLLNFDDAKHWVDVYRARAIGNTSEPDARVCTRFAAAELAAAGPPRYAGYPPGLLFKLLGARIAMLFS